MQQPSVPVPKVFSFFDKSTCTVSHIVIDPESQHCAIIDPVLDFDARSGRTHTFSADLLLRSIHDSSLTVDWILETHVHADHLSAAHYLRETLGAPVGIGAHVTDVQTGFMGLFNAEETFVPDGHQFDRLFSDGDAFEIGTLRALVVHTPGHTPACVTYVIEDAAFVGDTVFMPDYGTARCDFPGGDATQLYDSIRKIYALPPATRLFMCHDYPPEGRSPAWQTTVAEQRARNIHVNDNTEKAGFVAMRMRRDATLDMPKLILPSVQVNMRAGALPPPEANGTSYLKIPINVL